jgi:hypothetical protein
MSIEERKDHGCRRKRMEEKFGYIHIELIELY